MDYVLSMTLLTPTKPLPSPSVLTVNAPFTPAVPLAALQVLGQSTATGMRTLLWIKAEGRKRDLWPFWTALLSTSLEEWLLSVVHQVAPLDEDDVGA